MLETTRLILRPFCLEDLDLIFRLYSDKEIMRYMPNDLMNLETAQTHLGKIVRDWTERPLTNCEMAVISKEDQKKIGRARIHLDLEADTAMIGWLLLQDQWGKGYATEMTQALLAHCFDVLGVHRVCALCHPENIGSWSVLEKCHMRREAYYKQKCRYTKAGVPSWQDELEYALLDTEWKASAPSTGLSSV